MNFCIGMIILILSVIMYALSFATTNILTIAMCKTVTMGALIVGMILVIAGIIESAKIEIMQKINEKFYSIKTEEKKAEKQ